MALARINLGQAAFTEAWNVGAAMDLQQSIDYALAIISAP